MNILHNYRKINIEIILVVSLKMNSVYFYFLIEQINYFNLTNVYSYKLKWFLTEKSTKLTDATENK